MLSSNQRLSRRALVDRRFKAPKRLLRKDPTAMKNGGSPRWADLDATFLTAWVTLGYNATEIAGLFGRSRSAVCAKARRLGLRWRSTTPKAQMQALNRKRKAKRTKST